MAQETYLVESTDLAEVADAIRERTKIEESLVFPEAFKKASLLEDWPTEIVVSSTYSIGVRYSTTSGKKTTAVIVSRSSTYNNLLIHPINNIISIAYPATLTYAKITGITTANNGRTDLTIDAGKFIGSNVSFYSSSYSCTLRFNTYVSLDWSSPISDFYIKRTVSGAAISGVGEMPSAMGSILKYMPARQLSFYPEVSSINYFSDNEYITEIGSNSVLTIGNEAFYSCSALTKAIFPYCANIGENAFGFCKSLNSISFPVCNTICYGAFRQCLSLSEVFFPSCEEVQSYAFAYCNGLTTVSFPVCTSISSEAFRACSSLKTISFPVCSLIGEYAFCECTSLTTVSFPHCSTISYNAFFGCTNLKSVYLLGSSFVNLTASGIFSNTPMEDSSYIGTYGSIYVPSSMLADYKTLAGFSTYADRLVGV